MAFTTREQQNQTEIRTLKSEDVKKIQVTERNKNKGPFLPDVIQKDVAKTKSKKKEKGIAYFYFVHFFKERAKSKCTVLA